MNIYDKIFVLEKVKLDKIPGKTLTDNNYSDDDKQKVADSMSAEFKRAKLFAKFLLTTAAH